MSARRWLSCLLLGCLIPLLASGATAQGPAPMAPSALVLYDSGEPYGWIGELHAILAANLLGHFPVPYTIQPVEDYTAGQLEDYSVIFYFGTEYDNPLPAAFLSDVMAAERTVCWLGYNLWQIAWTEDYSGWNPDFTNRYGFQFYGVDSSGYPEILYKGESLSKHPDDPDIGRTVILDPLLAEVLAEALQPAEEGEPEPSWPYVVHSGHLWYFADTAFTYLSEEDRYLAFCDLLHDIVGIDHATNRRALIRIEDVDPTCEPTDLESIARYLRVRNAPFQIAVIPVYKDPLGAYGTPTTVCLHQSPDLCDALDYMEERDGQIFLHGYTHQYDSIANPYNGVTGDDNEFFLGSFTPETGTQLIGPVPEDSVSWVNDRIDQGLAELDACGFSPIAWETPHYVASALDSVEFGNRFDLCSGRMLYFTSDGLHFAGQFFPYPIKSDIYGQRISPENLGNVEPFPFYDFPLRFPEDIVRAAQKNLVIRDGWASAYFHPFYDRAYLTEIVEGIQALGYTYTAAPTLVAEAGPNKAILAGGSSALEGSASGGTSPYSYSWTPTTGLSNPNAAHPTANPTTTTVYLLTVTDHLGRKDDDITTVTVTWPVPVANFSASPTTGTAPLAVSFSDLTTNTPTSWSWSFGDGYGSSEQHPSHTYQNPGGTTLLRTVGLTAANPGGSDTETKTNYISIVPPTPVANFSATPASGTAPLVVTFIDTSSHSPTSWSWSFGDGGTSTEQDPTHTYQNAGGMTLLRTVSLTATNAGGADTETKTDYISVVPPAPTAEFSGAPTSGTASLGVTFTDLSNNHPTSWLWDFGDGFTSTAQNPGHTYGNPGGTTLLRTVALTATNDGGSDTETKTNYITVVPPAPVAEFSGAPTSGTAPLQVTFTDLSTNSPTSWSWDFGDASTSTEQNPSHTYTNTGGVTLLRTVSLTAANDGGSDTETKTDYVSVVPPAPVAAFSGTPTTGTAPLQVTFTDLSTNSPTSWSWSFGDGSTSTAQNPMHTYQNSGGTTLLRTVGLTATNDGGADTETKTDYISVVPPAPVAAFSGTPTSGTAPLQVTFTDLSTNNPTSWSWNFGDGSTSPQQNPSHAYTNTGGVTLLRTVALTAANDGGSDIETKTDYIIVVPPTPAADFSAAPTSGAAPLSVTFTDASTNSPTSWSWSFGDGSTSAEQHPIHTYQNSGGTTLLRAVSLTATNDGGSDTETKTDYITVVPPAPVAEFSGAPTSGTAPLQVTFTDLSTNSPTSWLWSFGDGSTSTEQNPSHTYTNTGGVTLLRTVGLTAANDGGSDTETKTNYITVVPPAPVAEFSATPTDGTTPLEVTFSDLSANSPTSWSWSFGDGDTSTAQNPTHTYTNAGGTALLRTVALTATNDGGADTETKLNYIAVIPLVGGADFTAAPTAGTAPLQVSFTDLTANSPTSWSWSFGDGSTSTEQHPIHTYQNSGGVTLLRTVSLTATNDGGSDTETKINYISVAPLAPIADFSATPTAGTAPLEVTFTDLSANSPTSWSWDFGDAGTSAEQNPSHTYEHAGVYTIALTATNAGGSDTETKAGYLEVTFADVPADNWAYSYILACVNAGIVQGVGGNYLPEDPVNRAAMAVYAARAVAGGDSNVPAGPVTATFPDVPTDHWAFKYVEYAYAQNIVGGVSGIYYPDDPVTRAAMAVYIARSMEAPDGDTYIPDPTPPATFPDVSESYWAWKWIEYCYAHGVVQGVGGNYLPEDVVTRAAMSVYVQRAFDLPM